MRNDVKYPFINSTKYSYYSKINKEVYKAIIRR